MVSEGDLHKMFYEKSCIDFLFIIRVLFDFNKVKNVAVQYVKDKFDGMMSFTLEIRVMDN